MKRACRASFILLLLAAASPALAAGQAQQPQQPAGQGSKFEPEADRLLRQMSDFLGAQRQFTVHTEGSTEAVLDSGQKIQFHRAGTVAVSRPDRLRVDRKGDLGDVQLFYDGRQLSLYGAKTNTYATVPAPPTLDDMLDMALDQLGLEPPAMDLLYSNPYAVLSDSMNTGRYLGRSTVGGVATHHLAFQGDEVDVQLWIEDGPRPLPLKYIVISKKMEQSPEYEVVLSDWNLSPRLQDSQFTFSPPADAMKVSFIAPQRGEQQPGTQAAPKKE